MPSAINPIGYYLAQVLTALVIAFVACDDGTLRVSANASTGSGDAPSDEALDEPGDPSASESSDELGTGNPNAPEGSSGSNANPAAVSSGGSSADSAQGTAARSPTNNGTSDAGPSTADPSGPGSEPSDGRIEDELFAPCEDDGATRCFEGLREQCVGGRWALAGCPGGGVCLDANRCDLRCNEGEYQCNGALLRICDNGVFQTVEDCLLPSACDADQAICHFPECLQAMYRCVDGRAERCGPNRVDLAWEAIETCEAPLECYATTDEAGCRLPP